MPAATPALTLELADLSEFGRLVEQQGRRCQREGQRLSALTLRVQFDEEPDAGLRQQCLAQCMHRLHHKVRATDTLARWESTNFGLLLPRCTPTQAERVLARLVRGSSGPYRLQEQLLELSVWGSVFEEMTVRAA